MKSIIKIGAVVVALVAFTSGCGSSQDTEASSPAEVMSASPELTKEDVFVMMVHKDIPVSEGMPDESLVAHGKSICTAADMMSSSMDMLNFMDGFASEGIMTVAETSTYMGYAVGAFCPEHAHLFG